RRRHTRWPRDWSSDVCSSDLRDMMFVIQAAERTGARHPLLDKHHISWLWCVGKTRAALSFAIKSANHWRRSYLFAEVAGLYVLKGQEKKSERYFRLANALAADELQSKRPKQ